MARNDKGKIRQNRKKRRLKMGPIHTKAEAKQSPLPFAVTTKRTYEHMEKGGQQHNHKV